MAVLIKGIEYPRRCNLCPCFQRFETKVHHIKWCGATRVQIETEWEHLPNCPLVLCEDDRVPTVDESLNKIMEVACEYCKHPGWYKDPDDLIKEQCNTCKLAEIVDKVLYGESKSKENPTD